MTFPGFTAEDSLYSSGERYKAGAAAAAPDRTGIVVPAMRPTPDACLWNCRAGGGDWPECWYYCTFLR